jgi:hypothetical protein
MPRLPAVVGAATLALLPLLVSSAAAQPRTRPVVLRPGITAGPVIAAPGTVLLSAGASRDPSATWRVGEMTLHLPLPVGDALAGRAGVRLGMPSYAWRDVPARQAAGLEDASVSLVLRAVRASAAHPGLVAIAGTRLPTGTRPGVRRLWAPSARVVGDWPLTTRTTVFANAAVAEVPAGVAAMAWQSTGTVWMHRTLGGPVGAYVEGWSTNARSAAGGGRAGVHGGLTLLVGRDLHLDAHWGRSLRGPTGTLAGVGWMARF